MKDYKLILTNFYKKHNPDKIREIDSILIKYQGQEELVIERLAKKYNAESTDFIEEPENENETKIKQSDYQQEYDELFNKKEIFFNRHLIAILSTIFFLIVIIFLFFKENSINKQENSIYSDTDTTNIIKQKASVTAQTIENPEETPKSNIKNYLTLDQLIQVSKLASESDLEGVENPITDYIKSINSNFDEGGYNKRLNSLYYTVPNKQVVSIDLTTYSVEYVLQDIDVAKKIIKNMIVNKKLEPAGTFTKDEIQNICFENKEYLLSTREFMLPNEKVNVWDLILTKKVK